MKKQLLSAILALVLMNTAALAQLLNTGWKRPSATHLPNDWTNPQRAYASDDSYAEVLHQSGCRCPFMDLSWNGGTSYTSSNIFGPYGSTDSYRTQGDSTDGWGHTWTDSELSDSSFVLRIWNSSTLLKQGYANFGFAIPAGSTISGIEVEVEAHGDTGYVTDFVDMINVKVYYYLPTAVNEVYSLNRELNVFPNPARGLIHLRFAKEDTDKKIQLVNLQGEVLSENIFSGITSGSDYTIDVSRFSAGIYFLYVTGEERTVNARIVIQ